MKNHTALLVLEDGLIFQGRSFGATGEKSGEVVFNTSLTGYQEVLTDPSYAGQIVVMTYPEIGNYGVNSEDIESRGTFVQGFVVRDYVDRMSNWRAEKTLDAYLKEHGIVGISDIDTRKLVRHLRNRGAMRGIISSQESDVTALQTRVAAIPQMLGQELATVVSCDTAYQWPVQATLESDQSALDSNQRPKLHVVAYDFGIKYNILRHLAQYDFRITVVPAQTSAEEVIKLAPDGIFLSNGPGDPEPLMNIAQNVRRLADNYPVFGICLGHQILGLAFGGKTYKLKFGHRGGNQPVKNLLSNQVEITSHNHGFSVDIDSLPDQEIEATHINLNDHTLEGMRHRHLPVFSVQYHPEAAPGPHDASYLFDQFYQAVKARQGESTYSVVHSATKV